MLILSVIPQSSLLILQQHTFGVPDPNGSEGGTSGTGNEQNEEQIRSRQGIIDVLRGAVQSGVGTLQNSISAGLEKAGQLVQAATNFSLTATSKETQANNEEVVAGGAQEEASEAEEEVTEIENEETELEDSPSGTDGAEGTGNAAQISKLQREKAAAEKKVTDAEKKATEAEAARDKARKEAEEADQKAGDAQEKLNAQTEKNNELEAKQKEQEAKLERLDTDRQRLQDQLNQLQAQQKEKGGGGEEQAKQAAAAQPAAGAGGAGDRSDKHKDTAAKLGGFNPGTVNTGTDPSGQAAKLITSAIAEAQKASDLFSQGKTDEAEKALAKAKAYLEAAKKLVEGGGTLPKALLAQAEDAIAQAQEKSDSNVDPLQGEGRINMGTLFSRRGGRGEGEPVRDQGVGQGLRPPDQNVKTGHARNDLAGGRLSQGRGTVLDAQIAKWKNDTGHERKELAGHGLVNV